MFHAPNWATSVGTCETNFMERRSQSARSDDVSETARRLAARLFASKDGCVASGPTGSRALMTLLFLAGSASKGGCVASVTTSSRALMTLLSFAGSTSSRGSTKAAAESNSAASTASFTSNLFAHFLLLLKEDMISSWNNLSLRHLPHQPRHILSPLFASLGNISAKTNSKTKQKPRPSVLSKTKVKGSCLLLTNSHVNQQKNAVMKQIPP
mmetsp:Transcript_155614/g.270758  ORF Transcript_155614/g.270758 Transcript_155614/m.270758 type:complete len:211 (+) Transcript_155614:205-837(+)